MPPPNQMPYRMLQPLTRLVAANADLDHQRQAREEEPVGMPLAAEIAADETRRLAAPAQAHGRQLARQIFAQRGAAVDECGRRSVRDRMRIAMRDDQDIAGFDRDGGFREHHDRLALGHQVILTSLSVPGASTCATSLTCGTRKPHGAVHSA